MTDSPSRAPLAPPKSVAIVGGGVAGIAAAVALADAGLHVEIYEKRPLLGGRASSFVDHATGERIDDCQHGTMRCCTNLADLLERLQAHDRIRYLDRIDFLDGEGKRSSISGSRLPAPLHTGLSFLRFRSLGARDKLAIARGLVAILRRPADPDLDCLDFAAWLARMRQTPRAIQRFWKPILVSACNERLDRLSCLHAFKIFRDGFLANSRAFHFGIPRVPLGTLYTEPVLAYLERRGGCAHLRTTIEAIASDAVGARVAGLKLVGDEPVEADYYVSALPFDVLLKLLAPEIVAAHRYFEDMRRIELSPIIGVHLWFDRPLDCPHAVALSDRRSHWIFNKTRNFDRPVTEPAYLEVVISAAPDLAAMAKEEVLSRVLNDVREAVPGARDASVVKSYVVKERKATFSPRPGIERLRPDQRTPIANLFVAGEWTNTGWPSTMESAVRSGYRAAEHLLAAEGIGRPLLAADLPAGRLVTLLAGNARGRHTRTDMRTMKT